MRIDEWTSKDDVALAEIVLRYIREGRTQLEAFETAAEKLRRTNAACAYRWNSQLRQKYQQSVTLARAHRKKVPVSKQTLEYQLLREENERLKTEVNDLRERNKILTRNLNTAKQSRKMDHLLPDDDENRPRYRMDKDGNLSRIE